MTTITNNGPVTQSPQSTDFNGSLPLPFSNIFHEYTSVNYDFTLSSITKDQYNDPFSSNSYRGSSGNLGFVVLQSSNSEKNLTSITVPLDRGPTKIQPVFFIDNVQISSVCGLNRITENSNLTSLSFTVTEPYSMGLFPLALEAAATSANYLNWVDAVYLLTLKFYGQTDASTPSGIIADSVRYFPIKIIDINMEVTEAGASYHCDAVPFSEQTFLPDILTVKSDIKVQASTVGEASGLVEREINLQLARLGSPHRVQIEFPSTDASQDISNSKLINLPSSPGATNLETGALDPSKVVLSFAKGSPITDVINVIVNYSEYIAHAAKTGADSAGYIRLAKIEPQVLFASQSSSESSQDAKTFVFRVIPYLADGTRLSKPNSTIEHVTQHSPVKVYDYIYTGKNLDIINLDLSFNNVFRLITNANNTSTLSTTKSEKSSVSFDELSSILNFPSVIDVISSPGVPKQTAPNYSGICTPDYTIKPAGFIPYNVVPAGTTTSLSKKGGQSMILPTDSDESNSLKSIRRLYDAMLSSADLIQVTMKIAGDIYYLSDNAFGNTFETPVNNTNLISPNQMNSRTADTFIQINYKTPVDLDSSTGQYSQLMGLPMLNGLFFVSEVKSFFQKGSFTQELLLSRRLGQYQDAANNKTVDFNVQPGTRYV